MPSTSMIWRCSKDRPRLRARRSLYSGRASAPDQGRGRFSSEGGEWKTKNYIGGELLGAASGAWLDNWSPATRRALFARAGLGRARRGGRGARGLDRVPRPGRASRPPIVAHGCGRSRAGWSFIKTRSRSLRRSTPENRRASPPASTSPVASRTSTSSPTPRRSSRPRRTSRPARSR